MNSRSSTKNNNSSQESDSTLFLYLKSILAISDHKLHNYINFTLVMYIFIFILLLKKLL